MAGMNVDGLVSGLDTTGLINSLIAAERTTQNALKVRLASTQAAATAYRSVNTAFLAVTTAAEALRKPDAWSAAKAVSSDPTMSVSTATGATTGSVSFRVDQLATHHSVFRADPSWTSADAAFGAPSLTITPADGRDPVTLTFADGTSLTQAAAAINSGDHGLSAAVVRRDDGTFLLQVTARKTGAANAFGLTGAGTFATSTQGRNAALVVGTDATYTVSSDSNTFTSLLPGTTFTVTAKSATPVTITVSSDPEAVAATVQKLVDTVNSALGTVAKETNNAKGSTAPLRAEYQVSQLAGQLLDAVATSLGEHGSPATLGLQLTRDGKVTFDSKKFGAALAADPAKVREMVGGRRAGAGPDGVAGNTDDVTAITGIADRLFAVAERASKSTTGTLSQLASGQDSEARDIQKRIDAWDLRLAKRKEALSRQFTAMETALSSLRNQSTWLAGQLGSLPSS